jgi:two-component system, NarL family, response regulator LiaR
LKKNSPDKKIRIIIADDHTMLREAMRSAFAQYPDLEVLAEAGDGEEAVKLSRELSPDIVVMDIVMPKLNGIEATRRIRKVSPGTAVLILTAYDDDRYVIGLLEAGAAGYLLKSSPGTVLADAIRTVYAGESVLNPAIIAKILKYGTQGRKEEAGQPTADKLSVREMEVLKLAARGMSNKEIADELFLSVRTVKAHLGSVFSKMGVASRTEAIVTGVREGWLSIEPQNPETDD